MTEVQRLLRERDLTVAWLARRVDMHPATLQYQLQFRAHPNYPIAIAIAGILSVYPTQIIGEDGRWREEEP